jgi:hypothetical protein
MNDITSKGKAEGKLKGTITVQIEDKTGKVKESCTVENTITDAFLKRLLISSFMQSNVAAALRSVSKPSTGQYVTYLDSGTFGVYALNKEIDVISETVIPPYVLTNMSSIDPSVTFYNNGASITETGSELIPVDNRSNYSRLSGTHSFTFEYIKNSGVGSVRSICVGRHYNNPQNHTGTLIGEAIYQPMWTTGTVEYFLEHWITGTPTALCPKGNQQGTTVWKQVSSSSQFSANFVTKQITTYANSNLSANLLNANLVGGHVFNNSGTYVVIKATRTSSTTTSVTIRLTYCINMIGSTTVSTRDIVVNIPDGETYSINAHDPVMVSRPDNGTLEIWFTISNGELIVDTETTIYGARIYKIVIDTPTDPASSGYEIVDVGIMPYVVGQYSNINVGYYLSGFYFADLQNNDAAKTDNEEPSGVYYLPVVGHVTQSYTGQYNNSSAAYGIKVNEDLTVVYGDYFARTGTASTIASPVFTDVGVLYCYVNSTTMYYVNLSGVVSGANLPQTLTKGADDVLRLIYEYSVT